MMLQTAALLAIFVAETAAVADWRPQLHGQITVESAWRPAAVSPAGAVGLTQFMRPTWGDIAPATSPSCAEVDRTDPACSVRAQVLYMRRLLRTVRDAETGRDRWAMAQASYNMGPGNMRKERRACRNRAGCNPDRWYGHVEDSCSRRASACRESRAYPRKIAEVAG